MGLSPYGDPNSYVKDYSDKYLKERWYGPDGRAIKDRHHTNHGNSKTHPYNPHDQYWDWSDPDHPDLEKKSYPPSDSLEKPTEEPEDTEDAKSNEPADEPQKESAIIFNPLKGAGLAFLAIGGITWVVGNDISGYGAVDDGAIIPLMALGKQGLQLIFGG